jgi:hypothetical protein
MVVALLAMCFMLVSCLAYPLTPKMEVTCSCETSIDFQRTTRRCIPEDSALHNHCCETLKSWLIQIRSSVLVVHNKFSIRPTQEIVLQLAALISVLKLSQCLIRTLSGVWT